MPKSLEGSGPCPRQWEELDGDGPRRFCASCNQVVHDLDALPVSEIDELTRANPDGFCATSIAIPAQTSSSAPVWGAAFAAVVAAAIIGCSNPVSTGS
jgi:hypothetical protein